MERRNVRCPSEHLADALKRQQRAAGRKAKAPTKRKTELALHRSRGPPFDTPLPLLATIARTGHELSCSTRHVYELVEQRELELVHVGERASRITRESILRVAAKRSAPRPIKHLVVKDR
jgi:hypothetical protein